jgi:hypothetical protein
MGFLLSFEGGQRLDVLEDVRLLIDSECGAHMSEHPILRETQRPVYRQESINLEPQTHIEYNPFNCRP